MLARYAWQSLWRRPGRALLCVLGVTLCVGLMVALLTVTEAVKRALGDSVASTGAQMVIQKRSKPGGPRPVKLPKDLVALQEAVLGRLAARPEVSGAYGALELWVFPELVRGATRAVGQDEQGLPLVEETTGGRRALEPVVVAGLEPGRPVLGPSGSARRPEMMRPGLMEGRNLRPHEMAQAVVTEDFAEKARLEVGDSVALGPAQKFTVVGILAESARDHVAGAQVFVTLQAAQALLGQGAVVDTLFLTIEHATDCNEVAQYVEELLGPDVSITTESSLDGGTMSLISSTTRLLRAAAVFVVVFVGLLLLWGSMVQTALRSGETGLLRAVGWRVRDLQRLFALRGLYVGLSGAVTGWVLGTVVAWMYGETVAVKLPSALPAADVLGNLEETPLALPLSVQASWELLAVALVLVLVAALVGAVVGGRLIARSQPLAALEHGR